jgi:colicin import membrane protein
MAERKGDRWISVAQSLLLHAALVGAVAYGWWTFRDQTVPPPHTLAIEATVIDSRALAPAAPAPAPVKPQPVPVPAPEPAPEPTGPPAPTPEELAQRAKAAQDAAEQAQREVDEKRRADAAEVERIAQEEREKEDKRQAEQKRQAEEKRKEDAKRLAEEKRTEEEARRRAQSEAELQHSLAAEEHVMAARSNGQLASWAAQIQARIQRAWLKPPSAGPGIDCMVYVTQVPGGEVVNVSLGRCNGDAAVQESIKMAAFRASPLPPPPDPALFERNLEVHFNPNN